MTGLQICQGLYACPMSSGLLTAGAAAGGEGEFSLPRSILVNVVVAGVLKGSVLFKLLDQMELLNGVVVVVQRSLALPRIDWN